MNRTLKELLLPLPVAAVSLLIACHEPPALGTPPVERFTPVGFPTVPEGESLCDDDEDGVLEPCLSQAQLDNLFNSTVTFLCSADDKLAWLLDYYHKIQAPPACGKDDDK